MTKVVCDRCGQECIEGSTFYTIDIYGHDTQPTNDGRIAFDAYSQNFNTNLTKMLKQEKHYCKSCKDEIEAFINKPCTHINVNLATNPKPEASIFGERLKGLDREL